MKKTKRSKKSIKNRMKILIYKKGAVRITATTSDEGGVTENDIGLIESVEILVS